MKTCDVLKELIKVAHPNDLFISSLGRTAEEIFKNVPNRDRVLFLDCMGAVTGVAVGVALACSSVQVYALETDGSVMYDLSILHTISAEKLNLGNFTLFVFDNGILESGGGVKSRLVPLEWTKLAAAWGLELTTIKTVCELNNFFSEQLSRRESQIVVLIIDNSNEANTCTKDLDGIESKYRFKRFINDNIKNGIIRPCVKN